MLVLGGKQDVHMMGYGEFEVGEELVIAPGEGNGKEEEGERDVESLLWNMWAGGDGENISIPSQ